jgi:hypothetical protein
MSNLSLERLLFDRSDVAGSPQLGAHLLGDSSALITSTTVSSDVGLDVYILNSSLAVTQSGTWNMVMTDGTDTIEVESNGSINVNVLGTVATSIGADADDAASTFDPIHVGGTAYDQSAALGALSAAGDRGHLLMDLYRRVFINDAPNRAFASDDVGVSDTETSFPPALAGRTRVLIQNIGVNPCEIIQTGGAYGDGIQIAKGSTLSLEAGQALAFKAICATGKTTNIRVFELA